LDKALPCIEEAAHKAEMMVEQEKLEKKKIKLEKKGKKMETLHKELQKK
jgi:hypothetical protein